LSHRRALNQPNQREGLEPRRRSQEAPLPLPLPQRCRNLPPPLSHRHALNQPSQREGLEPRRRNQEAPLPLPLPQRCRNLPLPLPRNKRRSESGMPEDDLSQQTHHRQQSTILVQ
jgi:hypothetical protein